MVSQSAADGRAVSTRVQSASSVVERVLRERSAGRTLQAIADGLTGDGVSTARGGDVWRTSTVAALLQSSAGRAAVGRREPRRCTSPGRSAQDATATAQARVPTSMKGAANTAPATVRGMKAPHLPSSWLLDSSRSSDPWSLTG